MAIAKAINAGLRQAMIDDPKVLMFGEDVAELDGVFRVTEGLHKEFGPKRVFNTPIAESGIIGTAIGLAMRGYRPVTEIQFDGFIFPAFDQITTQLAKMQNRSEGFTTMPVVIRVPYGGGIGAVEHHSESPEALFAHTAGLRIISPSNPNDAYWMIQQAIKSTDPVMFFEPKRRYWQKGPVNLDTPPAGMHSARVLKPGTDVTIAQNGSQIQFTFTPAGVEAKIARAIQQSQEILGRRINALGTINVANAALSAANAGVAATAASPKRAARRVSPDFRCARVSDMIRFPLPGIRNAIESA